MLIGYLSALSARAGDTLDLMLSSDTPDVTVDLVRVLHGDENPEGPGLLLEEIPEVAPRPLTGAAPQETPIGSYAIGAAPLAGDPGEGLTLSAWIWPTLPGNGHAQAVMALPQLDIALSLDPQGHLCLSSGTETLSRTERPLRSRHWVRIEAHLDADCSTLKVEEQSNWGGVALCAGRGTTLADAAGPVLLAAARLEQRSGRTFVTAPYNGKIAEPMIRIGTHTHAWALQDGMQSQFVPGRGGAAALRLVNVPTRAMTGPNWTGDVHDWRAAPDEYGAIHFHEDDLADACWPVMAQVVLPTSLPSGVYAVRLTAKGEATDLVPFALRPAAGQPTAKIALILSSYTYAAYANEHLTEGDFEQASDIPVETGVWEEMAKKHQEWGKSLYDLHSDGSGVAHSSMLRPVPNMRPNYRFWGFGAPRRFSADLYIVHFLHQRGFEFDVFTEHDLQAEHETILDSYQLVMTGTHPEYTSGEMLDAYDRMLGRGGCVMYLGGDGFYWVTTPVPGAPHVVEVRKSEGLRHWDAEPGERHHAGTGELGGLWRTRGRAANKLFGIGMAANGWDRKAPGYRRSDRSREAAYAWAFEGIAEEVIGEFGLIMDGTSGDEIDRIDYRWGTPQETVVLASSTPHSEWYVPVPEDVTTVSNQLNGQYNADVRSDITLLERPGGGAVFSVGSIIFCGALPVNGGRNNVAQLLENVVRNFVARSLKG